ncbi:hypothetical protein ACIRJO_27065 [Streptomyces sp. NPDC102394]|uniref:hypothetical protein n=1 Tax=Streptomyces sp. NPDC102394 TaxID=3366167 RepID=UPI00380DECC2
MTQMLILGLLLLAITGAFTGLVITGNLAGGPEYEVSMPGHHMITVNTLAVSVPAWPRRCSSAWACTPRQARRPTTDAEPSAAA